MVIEQVPAKQEKLSVTIAPLPGSSVYTRRHRIHAMFGQLRSISRYRGIRLTEGRRRREPNGTTVLDFIVVPRRP